MPAENSGCSPVQVPIIKVKVSAPRRSSSQAARGRDPLLAAVSQRFTFSAPRPPRHTSSNQPTLLPAAAGTVLLLCSTSVAKLLLLRTFSAHSALGLETRATEMECFLMTGSTRGREGCNIGRRGNAPAGCAACAPCAPCAPCAAHLQKVHWPAYEESRQSVTHLYMQTLWSMCLLIMKRVKSILCIFVTKNL